MYKSKGDLLNSHFEIILDSDILCVYNCHIIELSNNRNMGLAIIDYVVFGLLNCQTIGLPEYKDKNYFHADQSH